MQPCLLEFTCVPGAFTLDRTLESQKGTWESPGKGVKLPLIVAAGVVTAIQPDDRLPKERQREDNDDNDTVKTILVRDDV